MSDALLPKHTYNYTATLIGSNILFNYSAQLTVTTMDTTSHNFTWSIDTLGDGNSSILYDVTILNDTLAYVVGEIYLKDSTGQFNDPGYNAARWDGKKWNLLRILVRDFGGVTGYFRLKTVYSFADNDVWFAGDADLIHWNGSGYSGKALFVTSLNFDGQVLKMWGINSSTILCVGRNGAIYSYYGTGWQKFVSGTSLDIQDIWGAQNKAGDWEVTAAAGNYLVSNRRQILRITGTSVTTLSDSGINGALNSLWFSPASHYWVVGDGVWEKPFPITASRWQQNYVTTYTTNRIRGTEVNNIFFCGAYGDCFHFNGINWQSARAQTNLPNGEYLSVAVKENMVLAVGYEYPRAVIARGHRP